MMSKKILLKIKLQRYKLIMSIGFWQIAIVVVLVVLLFGRGKISDLMGDVAKGIKSFKKGMKDPSENQNSSSDDKSSEDPNSDKK